VLKEKIKESLKDSLKGQRKNEVSTLRLLLASILNKEKEKRAKIAKAEKGLKEEELVKKSQLTDEEIMEVVLSEVKKNKEAILEFEKGKREDLVKKGREEIEVLKKYLPEPLSEREIEELAKGVIKEIGAKNLKDLGKVMGNLIPKVKGRAEGEKVAQIVRDLLSPESD